MKISEATLLEDAFEAAWPFILNRLDDWLDSGGHAPLPDEVRRSEYLTDQAFNEFVNALDEIGVTLEEVDVPLKEKEDAP